MAPRAKKAKIQTLTTDAVTFSDGSVQTSALVAASPIPIPTVDQTLTSGNFSNIQLLGPLTFVNGYVRSAQLGSLRVSFFETNVTVGTGGLNELFQFTLTFPISVTGASNFLTTCNISNNLSGPPVNCVAGIIGNVLTVSIRYSVGIPDGSQLFVRGISLY